MFKNKYIIIFGVLFSSILLFSCKNDPNEFFVKGKLQNVQDGFIIAVLEQQKDSVAVDTIRVDKNGAFKFRSKVDTLTVMSLYFNNNTKNTYILVDKGWNVEMTGDVNYPDLIEVKGGDVNNDLSDFKNKNKELLRQRTALLEKVESAQELPNDSLSNSKDYSVELKNVNFDLSNIAAEYVKSNPTKIASVVLINTFFKDDTAIPRLDDNLALLRGDAENSPLTQSLRLFSNKIKKSAVGSSAPYFALKDVDGKLVDVTQFRKKYLLLSFASTTCDVCNRERKDAVDIYKDLKKKKEDIEFATIIINSESEPIGKNITDSMKWTILPDYGGWAAPSFEIYNIHEIPYNILISPTGIILQRDIPILDLPAVLAKEKEKTAFDE